MRESHLEAQVQYVRKTNRASHLYPAEGLHLYVGAYLRTLWAAGQGGQMHICVIDP